MCCGLHGLPPSVSAAGTPPETPAVSGDWIYFRQYEVYWYLLRVAELPKKERSFFRQRAYEFFFQYWILHRSEYAQLDPIEEFEESFAVMLKNHTMPFLDPADPLEIKSYYRNGQFVPKPLPKIDGVELKVPEEVRLPHVEGFPREKLKTWDGYQKYVVEFRNFIDAKKKQRLEKRFKQPPRLKDPTS